MAKSINFIKMAEKKLYSTMVSEESNGRMDTQLSISQTEILNKLSHLVINVNVLCISITTQRQLRLLSKMDCKYTSFRTTKPKNISRMGRKRSVSQMVPSSVFSQSPGKRNQYSLMGQSSVPTSWLALLSLNSLMAPLTLYMQMEGSSEKEQMALPHCYNQHKNKRIIALK